MMNEWHELLINRYKGSISENLYGITETNQDLEGVLYLLEGWRMLGRQGTMSSTLHKKSQIKVHLISVNALARIQLTLFRTLSDGYATIINYS